ncbi:MAG TPA: selenocysteine synthase, partial [Hanamia sp.]|nr:selenocysteine synthase [Hanamia sp.]
GMKVNKEEILGMYAALDRYIRQDHDEEWKMWEDRAKVITDAVKGINGVTTSVTVPSISIHCPSIKVLWDTKKIKLSRLVLGEKLRMGSPSIEVVSWGDGDNSIDVTVFMLKAGQEKIVGKRIREELQKAFT